MWENGSDEMGLRKWQLRPIPARNDAASLKDGWRQIDSNQIPATKGRVGFGFVCRILCRISAFAKTAKSMISITYGFVRAFPYPPLFLVLSSSFDIAVNPVELAT